MTAALSPQRSLSCCAIQHTETVEDYLKMIYRMTGPGQSATTSLLAARLEVAPASASAMLHRLERGELVKYTARGQVVLTDHGEQHALAVVRRHRLLETFLHRSLGVGWAEVHAEAELLEHGLSERVEGLIDAALGYPDRDPHGDPIPPRTGAHQEHGDTPLETADGGDRFLVRRVSDRDSAALRYLDELGIRPGVSLRVEGRAPFDGPWWVCVQGRRHALGHPLVALISGHVTDHDVPDDVPGEDLPDDAPDAAEVRR